jgi:hypothetical protein
MPEINANNRMDANISDGHSFGYQELIGKKAEGGMGDRISGAYQDVQDAMTELKKAKNSGDPALLMDLQLKMNSLMQAISTTTQMINGLKQSVDGINRNI